MFYYHVNEKLEGLLIFHVDDVLSAGSRQFKKIIDQLRNIYNFGRIEKEEFVFTGLNLKQTDSGKIELHQREKLRVN